VKAKTMSANSASLRSFFPPLEPYHRGRLRVSALHELYYEECGNRFGKPVVILHGGPGGGLSPFLRRLHDPQGYRIILFDQRGCGASTPHASLEENTTWHLVSDMEVLRGHCGVERWQVFGGSWGSTLALAYAQTHPERVRELVLRGIFTLRHQEVRWLYQHGASEIFPEAFAKFRGVVPQDEWHDLVSAYHQRLTGPDANVRMRWAAAWSAWEGSCLTLLPNPALAAQFTEPYFAEAFARIECHYFYNKGFFSHDGALLDGMAAISHLPGVIVQGRYDMVTPAVTAVELAAVWPRAALHMIADAGHATGEPGITDALVRATDEFLAAANFAR
jgi:proline iminopeptidase